MKLSRLKCYIFLENHPIGSSGSLERIDYTSRCILISKFYTYLSQFYHSCSTSRLDLSVLEEHKVASSFTFLHVQPESRQQFSPFLKNYATNIIIISNYIQYNISLLKINKSLNFFHFLSIKTCNSIDHKRQISYSAVCHGAGH